MVLSRRTVIAGLGSSTLLLSHTYAHTRPRVDVALVLGVDSSYSIKEDEWSLQQQGYIAAFRSLDVHRALFSGEHGSVAICAFEWSEAGQQRTIVPWMHVQCVDDAHGVSVLFQSHVRQFSHNTSISGALAYAHTCHTVCPFAPDKRIVDISGDGENNNGMEPFLLRHHLVKAGVTVNGLPILGTDTAGLDTYYLNNVAAGEGSFVLPAQSFSDFALAVRRKIILEVSRAPVLRSRIVT